MSTSLALLWCVWAQDIGEDNQKKGTFLYNYVKTRRACRDDKTWVSAKEDEHGSL